MRAKMDNLLRKGARYVSQYMLRNGYVTAWEYEDSNGNYVVMYSLIAAGVVIKSVEITFSPNWRVIKVA